MNFSNTRTSQTAAGSDARQVVKHVMQGNLYATGESNTVLTTILGSCVATCLFDPQSKLGGMNHFLLPDASDAQQGNNRYGVHAMELLINDLLRRGAKKSHMVAKIFGGADMISNERAVGLRNVEFALAFLENETIPCISQSVGGRQARRIRFWPQTGQAKLKFIENDRSLYQNTTTSPTPRPKTGDIELF
ncbi:MAG: chemotaxis protein CheD [Pseudomonadota bacterium]